MKRTVNGADKTISRFYAGSTGNARGVVQNADTFAYNQVYCRTLRSAIKLTLNGKPTDYHENENCIVRCFCHDFY